ncbi:MAG TPA: hypothetical protein VFR17_12025 [Mycobacterium sp.]|nr:hypothetical protein [Mycobacterium sp.]
MITARAGSAVCATLVAVGLAAGGVAPPAAALPPGFPDLAAFTAAPAKDYLTDNPKWPGRYLEFSTPYNIQCSFGAGGFQQPGGCVGDMPGMDKAPYFDDVDRSGGCSHGLVSYSDDPAGMQLSRVPQSCDAHPEFNAGRSLGAGQKVSYAGVTCAVGADRLVACLDTAAGEHGFVLRPAGSTAF